MIWTIAETAILLILWILRRTVPGIPAAIPARTAAGIPGRTRRRIAAGIKHTTAAGTIWITAAEISRLRQEKGRLLREDGLFLFHRKVRPMKQKSAPQGCALGAKAHSFFADCPTAACLHKI